jgi:thiosulfate dehydrogenase [quinone] large subunit
MAATSDWNNPRTAQALPVLPSLFTNTRAAWLWLPVRLYVGYEWVTAGWQKLSSPAWMQGGTALRGFWQHAVSLPPGLMPGAVYYGWYYAFLHFMLVHGWFSWFAKLVALGETGTGVLLVLGAFTGFAAGMGAFLNFNYMLAGSTSANPVLFSLEVLLLLAWRVAGRVGVDAVALRALPSSARLRTVLPRLPAPSPRWPLRRARGR